MIRNIAVIAGGNTDEYEVSLKSAEMVMDSIDRTKFAPFKIILRGSDWHYIHGEEKIQIDKNDFSLTINSEKINFDAAYIIVHGSPGEDGKLQGYLDMLEIPYSSPSLLASAITMNKYVSKSIIKTHGIKVAKAELVHITDPVIDVDKIVENVGLPCFVKPNNGGSSVATFKAKSKQSIIEAIEEGFLHDSEVIIEEFIEGKEITCGVYFNGTEIQTLPITEIVPHNEFFDYEAKYLGKSDEITPARIGEELSQKVYKTTRGVYRLLSISGLVRVDYILKENEVYFMEVNTVPGFTKQSLIPQQIRAAGMKEMDVLSFIIEETLS